MDFQNQSDSTVIFVGNVAHCVSKNHLKVFNGFLAVENGKISAVGSTNNISLITQSLQLNKYVVTELLPHQLLVPGFVDCHTHAPQFPNLGLGLDKPLLEWLTSYTFPLEKQYADVQFAINIYNTVVKRSLQCGTTTACYFGSLHLDSSLALAKVAAALGQRALIGKVSMNVPNDAEYFNNRDKELQDTEIFLKSIHDMKNDIIEPVITPRFALSCDEEMMKSLADLAQKYKCRIQSHVSENLEEIAAVKKAFPAYETYCQVYNSVGLLTNKCILAHGVHLEESEMTLLAMKGVSIAHCPASNTRLMSGLCPVRTLQEKGITVGLGTDVSGGDSPSVINAMRRCMDVSSHLSLLPGDLQASTPICWPEAFYLATLAGAEALSLDSTTGNFEIGKDFDALLVDIYAENSCIDHYSGTTNSHLSEEETIKNLLQLFIYLGDHRNITKVYVKGKEVIF